MVNPLSAVTQGFLSDGSHVPLIIAAQGLLIFGFVPVSRSDAGGSFGETDEQERGGSSHRREHYQREDDEILAIIKTWLTQ